MAKTKQFTIAVDNQPGAVVGIAKTLGNAKVNILSLLELPRVRRDGSARRRRCPARQESPRRGPDRLRGNSSRTVDLPNKPGALAQSLEKLAAKGVNLNSIYATPRRRQEGLVVYTVEVAAQAATATA